MVPGGPPPLPAAAAQVGGQIFLRRPRRQAAVRSAGTLAARSREDTSTDDRRDSYSGRQKIAGTLAARRQKSAGERCARARGSPRGPPATASARARRSPAPRLERPPRQVGGRGAPPAPADVGHFGTEPDLVELQTQLRDARLRRVPRERVARRQAAARGGRRPRARRARPGVRGVEGLGLRGCGVTKAGPARRRSGGACRPGARRA